MLEIDPRTPRARAGLDAVRRDRQDAEHLAQAADALKKGAIETAHAKVREVLAENPSHREAQQLARRIDEAGGSAARAAAPFGGIA